MSITRIHHLGLSVTDVEASAQWYSTVLGFHRAGGYASPDGARVKVFLRHDQLGVRLGLCQHASAPATTFDETRPGLDHLAFAVGSRSDLSGWEERLRAHGVHYTPAASANTLDGASVVVLRDPDNIQLELIGEDEQ